MAATRFAVMQQTIAAARFETACVTEASRWGEEGTGLACVERLSRMIEYMTPELPAGIANGCEPHTELTAWLNEG